MSKYIKLDDAIDAVMNTEAVFADVTAEPYQKTRDVTQALHNLPTIEVSDDCISREYLLSKVYDMDNDNLVVDLKDIENAPSVVPQVPNEDCISRAWVQNKLTEYVKDYALNELDSWQNTIVEWIATDIEDAPSVAPKRSCYRCGLREDCEDSTERKPMTHEIKIQKEYAQAVYLGEKTFEVRNNDRGYQKGDLIVFKVMDGALRDPTHPLNDVTFEITYALGSVVGAKMWHLQ